MMRTRLNRGVALFVILVAIASCVGTQLVKVEEGVNAALNLRGDGKYEEANNKLLTEVIPPAQKVIDKDPSNVKANLLLGISYVLLGKYEEALGYLGIVDPSTINEPRFKAWAAMARAEIYNERGLKEVDPGRKRALFSSALQELSQVEKLEIKEGNKERLFILNGVAQSYKNIGSTIELKEGRLTGEAKSNYEESIRYANKALDIIRNGVSYAILGEVYFEMNDCENALVYALRAKGIIPANKQFANQIIINNCGER